MEKDCLTIAEFCERNSVSRTKYYELKKQGMAPREIHIGSKPLITREAAADWRQQMESRGDA
jgi:predicted DNA-binding transcriptional regulator AlpA